LENVGPTHPDVASSLVNLGVLHWDLGDFAKALSLSKEALAMDEAIFGPEHPEVASDLTNVAKLLEEMGNWIEARAHLERALAILEKTLGPNHPITASRRDVLNSQPMRQANARL
jgi:tetratricopeptide (TPR) repeat protein